MKNYNFLIFTLLTMTLVVSCTDDFNEINERPDALASADVSAKYFVTNTQIGLFAQNRFTYWRGNLIHADRYAGQHTFGYSANWWDDGACYSYCAGWTNDTHDAWIGAYNSQLTAFTNFVKEGGELESPNYYAISLVMKALYYQLYTDTWGMIPFSEASNPDITQPAFDDQATIYSSLISDLDEAVSIIGSQTTTGSGVDMLAENDLFFAGDLQAWKGLANSMKLRLALRAYGAPGASFASSAISSAISSGVLASKNALIERDLEISQWTSAVYGDIWHNFYGGGNWHLGKSLVDPLRDNNDPRLPYMAKTSAGGTIAWNKPTEGDGVALFDKHVEYLTGVLDDQDAVYTKTANGDGYTITMPAGVNYIGQPTRLNAKIKHMLDRNLFSEPAAIVTNAHNSGNPIYPRIVFPAAESHFLIAEAITLGLAGGDAQSFYQDGLRHAMALWDVPSSEVENFIATSDMAKLNGSSEQNMEKIATQKWLVHYTDGFEAWAIVRDTGYPSVLANGVSDPDIYGLGELDGAYPQRFQYPTGMYTNNESNLQSALSTQGPDKLATKLWWAK